jgi:hypothetical protein
LLGPPVSALGCVADRVGERGLTDVVREGCLLCGPIAEARSESVHGQIAAAERGQHPKHGIVRHAAAGSAPDEHEIVAGFAR